MLRSVTGAVDDPDNLVPAKRPITVRDLLTFQAGHGMPDALEAPVVDVLIEQLAEGPPRPQRRPAADEWMSRLAQVPMVHQPGEGWTYNLGYEILGVLLARAGGRSLTEVLTDTILGPTGMDDTGFSTDRTDRMPSYYIRGDRTSSWSTRRTGSGRVRRRSSPAAVGWCRRSTTGTPSAGCCWPADSTTGAGSSRRSRSQR